MNAPISKQALAADLRRVDAWMVASGLLPAWAIIPAVPASVAPITGKLHPAVAAAPVYTNGWNRLGETVHEGKYWVICKAYSYGTYLGYVRVRRGE